MIVDCGSIRSGIWPKVLSSGVTLALGLAIGYLGHHYLRFNKSIAAGRVVPPDTFFFGWSPRLFGSYTNSISYLRFVVISQGLACAAIAAFLILLAIDGLFCPS